MDDHQDTYAPQSPDLSGFQTFEEPDPYANSYYQPQPYQSQQPQQSSYQPSYTQQPPSHDLFTFGHPPQQAKDPYSQAMPANEHPRMDHFDDDIPQASSKKVTGPGRRSKKAKIEDDECDKPAPGVEEGIDVKTKFPVARIKRIMQADEDVGKVAQVTPTAVSKALELFMISVVTKAASEARAKSAKRVTAAHLKQAVQNDEQLDFLADIMAKVPDAPAPKKRQDEDESDDMSQGKRKKRVGARRKRTKDDSDV